VRPSPSAVEGFGEATRGAFRDLAEQVAFLGAVLRALVSAAARPRLFRGAEVVSLAHAAGVEALGIIGLVNFLIGLIIAFIGGQVLATFGAQIFVADAIGIIMVRELGPIMTAILVSGRTGSAFAAELGTMRVNEEIDALETMGLAPVPLLVLPRVLAGSLATPLLTLYGMLAGVAAGLLQMSFLGFPLAVSQGRLVEALSAGDLAIGVVKSVVFGFLVAAVGCLRGLQAGRGPSAVGLAATRAVVSGIVLVIVVDALFAAVTTALGI
jgi:phospholipid/cholesterol/gamma-HCH transport system permease protein